MIPLLDPPASPPFGQPSGLVAWLLVVTSIQDDRDTYIYVNIYTLFSFSFSMTLRSDDILFLSSFSVLHLQYIFMNTWMSDRIGTWPLFVWISSRRSNYRTLPRWRGKSRTYHSLGRSTCFWIYCTIVEWRLTRDEGSGIVCTSLRRDVVPLFVGSTSSHPSRSIWHTYLVRWVQPTDSRRPPWMLRLLRHS